MSRRQGPYKPNKVYVTYFDDKIHFPSKTAWRMETNMERPCSMQMVFVSPFSILLSAEEGLTVRVAKDCGLKFDYEPDYIRRGFNSVVHNWF